METNARNTVHGQFDQTVINSCYGFAEGRRLSDGKVITSVRLPWQDCH